MNLVSTKGRVTRLENRRAFELAEKARKQCTCRLGGVTKHHSVEELEAIMQLGCPVHKVRNLGSIEWAPRDAPIDVRDENCCSCGPDMRRDYRLGKRKPLTEVEQQEYEEQRWEEFHRLAAQGSQLEEMEREIALTERFINTYEKALGETHGLNV
jgi:hypothetical protein